MIRCKHEGSKWSEDLTYCEKFALCSNCPMLEEYINDLKCEIKNLESVKERLPEDELEEHQKKLNGYYDTLEELKR